MRLNISIFVISIFLTASIGIGEMNAIAQDVDFNAPGYYSFESGKSISTEHFKTGKSSLRWDWRKNNAKLALNYAIPYQKHNPNPKETSVSTFVFWVYSSKPMEGELDFAFLKGGKVCCHFPYKLGFTGWRGAWVAFDRDMQGTPEEGMDKIVITIKGTKKGTLWFDGIIPSAFEDIRHHTPDFQAPFINAHTDMHWLLLERNWNYKLDIPVQANISQSTINEMDTISERFLQLVAGEKKGWKFAKAKEIYDSYGIRFNQDGSIVGKPIFFTRYGETFTNLGIEDASKQFKDNGQLLKDYNDNMLQIALAWRNSKKPSEKEQLAQMYVNMTKHLLDQGFAAGSAQGTLHHLGYSMRNFYTAPVIMKDVLSKAGLMDEVQQAMEWFSGVGEVKLAPTTPGMDIDAFNTYLMGRVAALIMLPNTPYKYAYFQALSRWIDNGFKYTSGLKACFKTDGTVFHHRRAYPAYAVGGFDGAVKAVWLLRGTSLAISPESHGNLRKALLEMKFYCNEESFPLSMSGRHPDGLGALIPWQYELLAEAGKPENWQVYDSALVSPAHPQGVKSYGYNSSLSVRKDNWLVTIAGHSRYLWATETYVGANHYGRYLNHGSMQILGDSSAEGGDGIHVSALGSGYQVAGFDWCHIPGTTAAQIPMAKMKANVLNVDEFSGYEEMLLSDEWFAGGVSHNLIKGSDKGNCGAYAMILHEHDKYNGSLRAHKSFFTFGNRIICLGSGLENSLPGSELHTTLFQNTIDAHHPTTVGGISHNELSYKAEISAPMTTVQDRFANTWFIKNADVRISRGEQNSLHEETDAPTKGTFEKAYIYHWATDSLGHSTKGRDSYEYMAVVHCSPTELASYEKELPYKVISATNSLHAVVDLPSGTVAAAAFEPTKVDEMVKYASACMLMYDVKGSVMTLSVSNPDLALYSGPSDEIYKDGKRVERSIYSRKWVDNDCGETYVTIKLSGIWKIYCNPGSPVEISNDGTLTSLVFKTGEARTEEIKLERVQ
jgi:chondroitin-sulfate-ABC endolyase/exolyase